MKTLLTFFLLTILILQESLLKAQSPDTISFDLKSITDNDTVVIAQKIMDCGEFGGHTEYITIYKTKKFVFAKLFQEPPCKSDMIPVEYQEVVNLNSYQTNLITDYLNQFQNMDINNAVESNAPSVFTVTINTKKYLKKYPNSLPKLEWMFFKNLRNALFLK
jgi:hypothetical protein